MEMKKIKKAGLKFACLLFGLGTFTACYGPAPYLKEPDWPEELTSPDDDAEGSDPAEESGSNE